MLSDIDQPSSVHLDSKYDNAVKSPFSLLIDSPRLASCPAFTVVTEPDLHQFTFTNGSELHTATTPNALRMELPRQQWATRCG
jgi:hypothetical protein